MQNGWLDAEFFGRVQKSVPIVCVDVVAVRGGEVGLIWRKTTGGGEGWCLIGGRVRHGETVAEAIRRHMHETLGAGLQFNLDAEPQPAYVAQYFPEKHTVGEVDPRQHAVALTFVLQATGNPSPGGEAMRFSWFNLMKLPEGKAFGFGQNRVLAATLRAADIAYQFPQDR